MLLWRESIENQQNGKPAKLAAQRSLSHIFLLEMLLTCIIPLDFFSH
jgi:hypothetical protein